MADSHLTNGPMNNTRKPGVTRFAHFAPIVIVLIASSALLAPGAQSQTSQSARPTDALHQLNDSVEALVERISPSVVQIQVSGYRTTEDSDQGQTSVVLGKQRSIGSGVIVDPDGYIVTNAHVVRGAQKIDVIVSPPTIAGKEVDSGPDSLDRTYDARIVGVAEDLDLAVIKIEEHHLPALTIRKSVLSRQGEMVFAFGSPEGLRNSVTMGVVSAVARQPDPDSPRVYVQTDTPINPGTAAVRWWMRMVNLSESIHSFCQAQAAIRD